MKKIILVIAIKGLLFSLIEMPLFCQTPLITNVKQIKSSVRNEIVSTSDDFVSLKNNVATSTTSLQNAISNEAQARIDALSSETQARTNTDNILTSQIQSLQAQSSNYVLRGGDTLNGNYIFNGNVGIGTTNVGNYKLYVNGKINASEYLINGQPLTFNETDPIFSASVSSNITSGDITNWNTAYSWGNHHLAGYLTSIYPYTANYFHLGDTDAYGRKRLWFYDTNSVLKLGGAISDGDGLNADSEGIVVINNTQDKMAIIKADRLGLTRSSDSSYYYFGVNPDNLFFKSYDTTLTRFFIDNTSGNIGIGTSSPQAKLDIAGNIKITDGTQGAGKVLTSDANGLASWQTPAGGSGDNLGNHIATMTLDMAGFDINNVKQLTINGDTASGQSWLSMYQNNSYLSGNGSNILNIINFSKITSPNANLGLGVSNPSYKLDVNGDINFTGTLYQNGVPFGGGSGDNLGNHIATTTLDMNNNEINNVNWITFYGANIGIDTNYEYSKLQLGKSYSDDISGISIGDYTITTTETNPFMLLSPKEYNPSGNIAIGVLNKSAGTNNIVLGEYSEARGHNNIVIGQNISVDNHRIGNPTGNLNIGNLITGQIVIDDSYGDTSWVYFNTTGGTYSTSPFYVQDSTSATKQLCLVGSVENLPTTGFDEGCFAYNYTEHKVYVSTENVVGIESWKPLW